MDAPLWTPSPERVAAANLTAFMRAAEKRWNVALPTYRDLHAFSLTHVEPFWQSVWEFCDIRGSMGERIHEHPGRMPGARFFPDARLNFAENLLRRQDDDVVIVFSGEDQVRQTLTAAELRREVARAAAAFRRAGIRPGDRIAAFIPNLPQAIIAMLGAAAIGAVVVVLTGLRRAGRARPVRPDRAAHPPLGGRLLLWREDA